MILKYCQLRLLGLPASPALQEVKAAFAAVASGAGACLAVKVVAPRQQQD